MADNNEQAFPTFLQNILNNIFFCQFIKTGRKAHPLKEVLTARPWLLLWLLCVAYLRQTGYWFMNTFLRKKLSQMSYWPHASALFICAPLCHGYDSHIIHCVQPVTKPVLLENSAHIKGVPSLSRLPQPIGPHRFLGISAVYYPQKQFPDLLAPSPSLYAKALFPTTRRPHYTINTAAIKMKVYILKHHISIKRFR